MTGRAYSIKERDDCAAVIFYCLMNAFESYYP
jgi:hypothetical protein